MFGVPAPAAGPVPPGAPMAPPSPYGPAYGYSGGYAPDPMKPIKVAGIFNIILGSLSVLWAGLMGLYAGLFASGAIPTENGSQPPQVALLVTIFLVMAIPSLIAAVIEIVAGIKLLRRSRGARTLGIVAGFVSVLSLWSGCCLWPFGIASGIYTLVVLFRDTSRLALEGGEPPPM